MCKFDLLLKKERLKNFLVVIIVSHGKKSQIKIGMLFPFFIVSISLFLCVLRARMTRCNIYYDDLRVLYMYFKGRLL